MAILSRTGGVFRAFLYFALLLPLAAACQEGYRVVQEDAREKGANVRLNRFTRSAVSVDGAPEWFLEAKEAYIYQKDGKETEIIAYDFKFTQYDPQGKVQSTVTAERGEIDYVEQQLRLSGGVLYRSAGQIIETETMRYDIETSIVSSDSPVVIREGSSVTNCGRGVVVDRVNERQVCKAPAGLSISAPDGGGEVNIFQ